MRTRRPAPFSDGLSTQRPKHRSLHTGSTGLLEFVEEPYEGAAFGLGEAGRGRRRGEDLLLYGRSEVAPRSGERQHFDAPVRTPLDCHEATLREPGGDSRHIRFVTRQMVGEVFHRGRFEQPQNEPSLRCRERVIRRNRLEDQARLLCRLVKPSGNIVRPGRSRDGSASHGHRLQLMVDIFNY